MTMHAFMRESSIVNSCDKTAAPRMSKKGELVLVSNLPPRCSIPDIERSISVYTHIWLISKCDLSFRDIRFDLRAAVLLCPTKTAAILSQKDGVDIVVGDYFTEVEEYEASDLVLLSLVLVGLRGGTTEEDIAFELDLDGTIEVSIQKAGSDIGDGFAYLRFPTQERRNNFYLSFTERTVNGAPVSVRLFPRCNVDRLVTTRCQSRNFVRLRSMKRFNDFVVKTPRGDFPCSSKILSMSSPVVQGLVACGVHELVLDVDGDYDALMTALYGGELVITPENCAFVHAAASILQIEDLITGAGCVCYESLTPRNYRAQLDSLIRNDYDIGYVVDFIAGTAALGNTAIDDTLPPPALKQIAKSRFFKSKPEAEVLWIFSKVLNRGLLDKQHIACVNNKDLDVNSNREMLVEYLDQYRKPGFTMRSSQAEMEVPLDEH